MLRLITEAAGVISESIEFTKWHDPPFTIVFPGADSASFFDKCTLLAGDQLLLLLWHNIGHNFTISVAALTPTEI